MFVDSLVILPSNVVKEVQLSVQSARKRDIYQEHVGVRVKPKNLQQEDQIHSHHTLNA